MSNPQGQLSETEHLLALQEEVMQLEQMVGQTLAQKKQEEMHEIEEIRRLEAQREQMIHADAVGLGPHDPLVEYPPSMANDEQVAIRRALIEDEERAYQYVRELEDLRFRRQLAEAQQRTEYFRTCLMVHQEGEKRRLAEEREMDRIRSRMRRHRLAAMVDEELAAREEARNLIAPEDAEEIRRAKLRMEELESNTYFSSMLDWIQKQEPLA